MPSLLFRDDGVHFALSNRDLQCGQGLFAAECEVSWIRISTSDSEAMVNGARKQWVTEEGVSALSGVVQVYRGYTIPIQVKGGSLSLPIREEIRRQIKSTLQRDYISWAWESLCIPPEEIVEVAGEMSLLVSLLRLSPCNMDPNQW